MVDRTLVISLYVATSCVLVAHVTGKLEIRISLAYICWTEARLWNYDQHFLVALGKTALPYTVW